MTASGTSIARTPRGVNLMDRSDVLILVAGCTLVTGIAYWQHVSEETAARRAAPVQETAVAAVAPNHETAPAPQAIDASARRSDRTK
jgi:hypothetical protein